MSDILSEQARHYMKVRDRARRIKRIRLRRLLEEGDAEYYRALAQMTARERREFEMYKQAQAAWQRANSYGTLPHGLLHTTEGLPKSDMSNVTFWGDLSKLGNTLFGGVSLDKGTVIGMGDGVIKLNGKAVFSAKAWTCGSHLTPVPDIPDGEFCPVCGRGEDAKSQI